MEELQTIGQEYYKGSIVKVYYTNELEIKDMYDKSLYQILYIDEGSVIVGENNSEKILITPVLLCLNYYEPQNKINITNGKGFSIFFKPEAINHGLIGSEKVDATNDYLATEQLLIKPFKLSNINNPVSLPVNGAIRERLLRMAENISTQLIKQPDNYWPCRGRSFFIEMLMLLQSMFKLQIDNSIEIDNSNDLIKPVLKEIHINYNNIDFSAKTLSKMDLLGKGFQKIKMKKIFKKTTGESISNYIQKLRCDIGDNLLKNTLLRIDEIARRCGYLTEEKFASDFIKTKKMTPTAWRAQYPNPYG